MNPALLLHGSTQVFYTEYVRHYGETLRTINKECEAADEHGLRPAQWETWFLDLGWLARAGRGA